MQTAQTNHDAVPQRNGAADTPAPSPGREPAVSALPPLLVRAAAAARLCGLSRATWHRLAAAGRTPAPLRLGGAVLWRVEEMRHWVESGCPPRREWEARQAAQRDGRRG